MQTPTKEQLADPAVWPDGAEIARHFPNDPLCQVEFYRKFAGESYEFYDPIYNVWTLSEGKWSNLIYSGRIFYRPIKPQWRGPEDGLPPVGTVCEYRLGDSKYWHKCSISYILNNDQENIIAYCHHLGHDQVLYYGDGCDQKVAFRPIRTPEQIAAEEREKAIMQMANIINAGRKISINYVTIGDHSAASALYDAGYRKCSE